jgi:hypothetical protein
MNNRKDVKIIQVSSEPDKNREIRSYDSLSQLGYRYIRIMNPRYMEYPPVDNVFDNHREWVIGVTKPDPNQWGLTSGHYGAWQGHMSAIFASFVDKDYTLICECDCLITVDPQFFKDRVDEAINLLENSDYKIVRFESPNHQVEYTEKVSDNLYLGNMMTLGHCYLIHSRNMDFWLERMKSVGWHSPDFWLNFSFQEKNEKMPAFKELILTKQAGGESIIDNTFRPERAR